MQIHAVVVVLGKATFHVVALGAAAKVMVRKKITPEAASGFYRELPGIVATGIVDADLLNSRFGYVAVSRASHEASIFTEDANRLNQRLRTEVSKSSALAMEQTIFARDQGAEVTFY